MKEPNQKQMRLEVVIAMVVWQLSQTILSAEAAGSIAKPGCRDRCGNTSIPYPFGIGPSYCYHNPWFEVECNKQRELSLKKLRYDVNESSYYEGWGSRIISFEQQHQTVIVRTLCFGADADGSDEKLNAGDEDYGYASSTHNLTGSPFMFSRKWNVLVVSGCGGAAILADRHNQTLAGCAAICINGSKPGMDCHGVGCCQSTISHSVQYFNYNLWAMGKKDADVTTWAVLVDSQWIMNKRKDLQSVVCKSPQVVLEWSITDLPVESPSYANSTCFNNYAGGLVCRCKHDFYQGNPYVPYGCQVVKECESCTQDCILLQNDTFGCPKKEKDKGKASTIAVGIGLYIGPMVVMLGVYWLHHLLKRRKFLRLKAIHFERNGGLLLKQQISSSKHNNNEKIKFFNSEELEKATNQYNEDQILGRGGQGMVYKGTLSNGKFVAIKKSPTVDKKHLNIFVNEMLLLFQTNHRNIVNLLGCCLETEVPILVYEYVPNGTLYQHIHAPIKQEFPIAWEMRLQIATDIANALAYLHSSCMVPIFHRDVKSSNILLDEKYRAKLSDFGTSKSFSVDQTHVTTNVIGTFGYLDPEYFHSCQFTDKSDVYSFGVVLVELLTGQKAIRYGETEERASLVAWFLGHNRDLKLYESLDAPVVREGREAEITAIADLARRCLNKNGNRRPTMKEVAIKLETIRSSLQQQGLTMGLSISSIKSDELSFSHIDITTEN